MRGVIQSEFAISLINGNKYSSTFSGGIVLATIAQEATALYFFQYFFYNCNKFT